ncbi:magnesium transporter [Methanocella arvoryzae]|uniref:Magnesium transporter MgtE n=1 Tax=Methanocella arvoryzae (strain DSM 22066 / NBRC 105507 / MRE50) TaxID=351160 RepID=Q0W5K9_METAR|nr:magnesium transporter [Methanocella arvoryzae]CAJ36334.1 Mg(2+) transporter [Methanocella arvoryzae MRE50]
MPDSTFEELFENKRWGELRDYLNSLDRVELSDLFRDIDPRQMVPAFRLLPKDKALQLFELMDVEDQARLIDMMGDPETIKLVESLDPDDRARLFEELPAIVTKKLLRALSPEARESVNLILGYPEGTAGRIMSSRYLSAKASRTAGYVLSTLHATPLRPDEMQVIFVTDDQRVYKGYVTLGSLIKAKPDMLMGDLARDPEAFVYTSETRAEAARIVVDYDLPAIAVVDSEKRLVGTVTFDDVLDVIEEETTEDFQKLGSVGVIKTSLKDASTWLLYQKRVPWLLILVIMNVFTGAAIAMYEGSISAAVVLVFFMPLIVASAGNAGAQSATLVVRALATGDVIVKDWLALLVKETMVALLIGMTLAIVVSLLGLYRGGPDLAVVIGLSMIAVVVIGSLIGMSLPFLLTRFHLDPASSSVPLVTSIADVIGVFVYLSFATWYLKL